MHAVVRDAWNAGLRADMKLDLAPTLSIMKKVYNLKLKSSLQKPGRQVFMKIQQGHIKLFLAEFAPAESVPL